MSRFVLVLTEGRSGSRFLRGTLQATWGDVGTFEHEALHADQSLPRRFARAWEPDRREEVLAHPPIARQIERWKEALERGPVVECGWTASHLAPALAEVFPDLAVVHLHRHPVLVAASRAVMGTYQGFWATSTGEPTPFDSTSPLPGFRDRWPEMTPFERCLYRWCVSHALALDVLERRPDLPALDLPSDRLFGGDGIAAVADLAGLPPREPLPPPPEEENRILLRFRESFPLGDDWRRYRLHPEALALGARLGHVFDDEALSERMARYQRPPGLLPWLRWRSRYWVLRSWVARRVRREAGVRT